MNTTYLLTGTYRRRRFFTAAMGGVALAASCTLAFRTLGADAAPTTATGGPRIRSTVVEAAAAPAVPSVESPAVQTLSSIATAPLGAIPPIAGATPSGAPSADTVAGTSAPATRQPAATPAPVKVKLPPVLKPVPTPGVPTAVAVPAKWSGFASAEGTLVDRVGTVFDDIYGNATSTSLSAAGTANGGSRLQTKDSIGRNLYAGPLLGTNAWSLAAPVYGADQASTSTPTVTAFSPSGETSNASAVVSPDTPPVTVTAMGGSAHANTTDTATCVTDQPLSAGSAQSGSTGLLELDDDGTGLPHFADDKTLTVGVTDSRSTTSLAPASLADGTLETSATAVVSTAKIWLPEVYLLKGTDDEIRLRFLQPVMLSVTAGGLHGTAYASYSPLSQGLHSDFIEMTTHGETVSYGYLTDRGFAGFGFEEPGVQLTVGLPAAVSTTADGTVASASADLVTLSFPKTNGGLPVELPGGGGPDLTPATGPLASALSKLYIDADALGIHEIHLGHLEASAAVPVGGVHCAKKTGIPAESDGEDDPTQPDGPPGSPASADTAGCDNPNNPTSVTCPNATPIPCRLPVVTSCDDGAASTDPLVRRSRSAPLS